MIYNGANLPLKTYSLQTIRVINARNTRGESDLFRTKWWDHRFIDAEGVTTPMHPMNATHLFFHEYEKALANAFKRRQGKEARAGSDRIYVKNSRSFSLLGKSQSEINGAWLARREADKHGIPYDFWCSTSMKYAEVMDWPFLPTLKQLYSKSSREYSDIQNYVSLVDFVTSEWADFAKTHKPVAQGEFYRADRMVSPLHEYQIAHQRYLVELIKNSNNKAIMIAEFVYNKRILLPKVVANGFGEELLNKARRISE